MAESNVIGEYRTLSMAKAALAKYPSESLTSRLVLEVINGIAQSDPHTVGGESQGSGLDAGFNKFWWDWYDINRMVNIANTYLLGTRPTAMQEFIVVEANTVIGEYLDVQLAKNALEMYPSEAINPSRMVVEVKNGQVQSDPHNVGGENQGAGVGAGFNKFWWNWNDINRMVQIAQTFVDQA